MCLYKAFYNHRNDLEISSHSYFIWGSRMYANFSITCPGYLETHYALSRVGLWKLQHFSQQRKVLRRISALWKILLKKVDRFKYFIVFSYLQKHQPYDLEGFLRLKICKSPTLVSLHFSSSLGGCFWIVRKSEPNRLLKTLRSLSVYMLKSFFLP